MGISIDKAIDRLEELHFEQDDWEYGELTEDCLLNREALRLAIDTMRKLKVISRIANRWKCYGGDFVSMQEIYEVLNENDDCK